VSAPRSITRPTLHLIDATLYAFRAYHSIPGSLCAPDGRSVNAVYGFAGFLLRYLGLEQPTHLALAFDRSLTSSFRNELYADYKSSREEPPEELSAQLADCEELGAALGLKVLSDERYEADDLIATLASGLASKTERCVVVSGDKDLAQLVDGHTELYDFARGLRLGPAEVRARFGVVPEQIADYLGLAGDAVDDIPGVRGVGPKTAAALIVHFGSLDELYGRLEEVAGLELRGARRLAERLEAGRVEALLSRQLARLSFEAPVRPRLEDFALGRVDVPRVEQLCERLGFTGLRERLLARK
jgi:DNA polymerase I